MTRLPAVWRLLAVAFTLAVPVGFAATAHALLVTERWDWALVTGALTAVDALAAGACLAAGERAARPAPVPADICPAQTGPVWKLGGESCGCTLGADPEHATHECGCGAWWDDSIRRDQPTGDPR